MDDMETLRNIGDPIARAKYAGDLLNRYQGLVNGLTCIRRESIEAAHEELGVSYTEIASRLGLSKGRISQICHALSTTV